MTVNARPPSRLRARSPARMPSSQVTRQSVPSPPNFQQQNAVMFRGSPTNQRTDCGTPNVPNVVRRQSNNSGVGGLGLVEAKTARASRLCVVVRKRPMNRREAQVGNQDVISCPANTVIVREPKLKVDLTKYVEEHNFPMDQAFDEMATNEQLYCACVRPVIEAVFNRAKCTCFAYGQTGSGKTYTMIGPPKSQRENGDKTPGIFLLAAQDIFRALNSKEHGHLGIYIAFYEIYCGKLFDLLNHRQQLQARTNAKSNVVIVGLQEYPVESVQELMEVIEYGLNSRTTGVTGANADSSRSHAVLQISLKENGRHTEHGKISFIDLAGSERGADTNDTDKQTRIDGAEINKSLLALKECIRALDHQNDHTPFRGSKLTQVLKDSFTGTNCRTVMIANVSPCSGSVEHSLNTLRYAYRVKELRRAGTGGLGNVELGSLVDGICSPPPHGELPGAEESSDEHETSRTIQEQSPINLPAAAQVGRSGRQVVARPHALHNTRDCGRDPGAFEDRSGILNAMSMPEVHISTSSDDSNQAATFESSPRPRDECLGQLRESTCQSVKSSGAGSQAFRSSRESLGGPGDEPNSDVPKCTSHSFKSGAVGTRAMMLQDISPEVALEPVGSSQATLDELARHHDQLIGLILHEEEELITAHRQYVDMMVEHLKEEMVQLNHVDRPGSDVNAYVATLDSILHRKAQQITELQQRVDAFKDHLSEEDALSRTFQMLASSSG